MRTRGTRARWVVPAGAAAVVGVVIAVSAAAGAGVPSLPHRTAAQLLADVAQAARMPTGPFSATVQQTSDLGLPALPGPAQQGGASSPLTTGTNSISIWYADPQHVRIAEPAQASESDVRRDGSTVWLWDSKTQTATQVTLPPQVTGVGADKGNAATPSGSPSPSAPPILGTPQAAASRLLAAIGPSTVVGVASSVYVADQPAYQLSLAPKNSESLVDHVLVAIDANRGIPLRVEVFGRGSAGLAYSIGFTKLIPGPPDPANFSFTPPPGATVHMQTAPSDPGAYLRGLGLPVGWPASTPSSPPVAGSGTPKVIGTDWLSVVATPPNPAVAAAVQQLLTEQSAGAQHGTGFFGSASSAAPTGSAQPPAKVPIGQGLAALRALLLATTKVAGPWGHGRLLQTALVSVLITDKGQILAGAVTPTVLYADVAQDAG